MEVNEVILKQLKCKDIEVLEPIIEDIGKHIVDGMLIYNEEQWSDLNSQYDKQIIRDALTVAIPHFKVDFPFELITENDVQKQFNNLRNMKNEDYIIHPETITYELNGEIKKKKVIEKFNDYKYSYENYGTCLIKGNPTHNDVSDYFQSENRHKCGTWNLPSTYEAWTTGKGLRVNLGALWRMGIKEVNRVTLKQSIRLGTYIATQFKPTIAKLLYDVYKTKKVIDISCGWGDRLAGFYTSEAEEYYGFDPNPETFKVYKKQCLYYEKLLGNDNPKFTETETMFCVEGVKKVVIQNLPAEDADFDLIPNDIDFVFSSPPYFSLEAYGKGGSNEESQSWCRYKEYDDWEKGFFHTVLDKCWAKLDDKRGVMAINIVDVIIKKTRHFICERMVEYMEEKDQCEFQSQIGMRMNLRPNTRNDDVAFDQTNKIPFVEPIWVFKKALDNRDIMSYNKCNDIEDLFE